MCAQRVLRPIYFVDEFSLRYMLYSNETQLQPRCHPFAHRRSNTLGSPHHPPHFSKLVANAVWCQPALTFCGGRSRCSHEKSGRHSGICAHGYDLSRSLGRPLGCWPNYDALQKSQSVTYRVVKIACIEIGEPIDPSSFYLRQPFLRHSLISRPLFQLFSLPWQPQRPTS